MTRLGSFCPHRWICVLALSLSVAGIAAPAWAQFETRGTTTLPLGAWSVAMGDLNRDGKMDAVVLDNGGFSVWLGDGNGMFRKGAFYRTQLAYSLAVADFNGDGKLDVIVANENLNPSTVSVYLGNGDGTFQTPIDSSTSEGSYFVVVADLNSDGKPDIVLIDPPYISVLLGNGDGTFQMPSDNNSFQGSVQLAVGDFNNDHKLDVVAVGSFGGSANIGVLLGNGDGTLQNSLTYPLTFTPCSVAAADFNSDGNLDAAIGGCGEVTVMLGNGNGSFQPPQTYSGGGRPAIIGDFNRDGRLDIISGATAGPGIAEFLGNGDGTFQASRIYSTGNGVLAAASDLNGDGMLDAVLLDGNHNLLTTMLNTGGISFDPTTVLAFPVQLIDTTSKPRTVKLTNTGLSAISVTTIKASGPFESASTCGNSVAAGASCTISATFTPSKYGLQKGVVTIVDSASSKPQYVELTGVATIVKLSPSNLKFGNQKVGTQSKPQVVTVTNEGKAQLNLDGPTFGGKDPHDFFYSTQCGALPPGGTCKVSVTFAPTRTGARSSDLKIDAQGTVNPPPVGLSGVGN